MEGLGFRERALDAISELPGQSSKRILTEFARTVAITGPIQTTRYRGRDGGGRLRRVAQNRESPEQLMVIAAGLVAFVA
jgi:hypothetical protein